MTPTQVLKQWKAKFPYYIYFHLSEDESHIEIYYPNDKCDVVGINLCVAFESHVTLEAMSDALNLARFSPRTCVPPRNFDKIGVDIFVNPNKDMAGYDVFTRLCYNL